VSFFSELKRRNVFRVGIAYAVTAWILLQVADLVLENLSAPPIVMKVFMLALAIGFPVALIFAWAFELTPEGIKLEKDVDRSKSITHVTAQRMNRNIIIALAIAVVLLLVDKFTPDIDTGAEPATARVESAAAPAPQAEEEEKSIAVLPFVDMSPNGDQGYFADGISEEILNVLVKTHTLKVAGRTSSFQFRGRSEDLRTIGEQLGVENILEGSIRKANNRVRITAQLVKASDGFHLWSETYDRDLTDIFAIQDEIARAITDAPRFGQHRQHGRLRPLPGSPQPDRQARGLSTRHRTARRSHAHGSGIRRGLGGQCAGPCPVHLLPGRRPHQVQEFGRDAGQESA